MPQTYRDKLDRDNAALLKQSRSTRDIARDFPAGGDKSRREACRHDLCRYYETYHPVAFNLAWSADHLRVIAKIQSVVLEGGLSAVAMPRGWGKTTMSERAALWALLFGHRRFVTLIGATEKLAGRILRKIKGELLDNDLLLEDFAWVCYPIRCLENNARRCVGQLFNGRRTSVEWSAEHVTFPTMPDDACEGVNVSGSTVSVAGITGALKGQSNLLATGEVIRPDFVLLDDVQTRESAMSPSQSDERAAIVAGDVLGMAGPGKQIAAVMPCTVVREGDLSDQFLDRQRNPQWQGERTKAVYSWPTNEKLWEDYHSLRKECQRTGRSVAEATKFYQENREAMDEGAVVAWPERYNDNELSAVQFVQNKRADIGEAAFAAEYENEPRTLSVGELAPLTAVEVADKLSGIRAGVPPVQADYLTMFIDVHDTLLYWTVAAWSAGFTGSVIAYGTYPDQKKAVFTLRKAANTLAVAAPGTGREGAIRAGLESLTSMYLGREWRREGGNVLHVQRCLVDAGYVPGVVFDFCRRSQFAPVLLPSRGLGIGAAKSPMNEWPQKTGELRGWNWVIGRTADRAGRVARFDANHWKSFVHARLAMAVGDVGSLTLFGSKADQHRLFAEHVVAEAPVYVSANGRTVAEWQMRPGVADNHWLDCLTGNAVAASILGAKLQSVSSGPPPRKPRMRLSEMQAAARARRGM